MQPTINNYYPAKVWLLTNAMGTFILFLSLALANVPDANIARTTEAIPLAFCIFFIGLLFSLPALGLFWVVFLWVRELNIEVPAKKAINAAAGILLVVITFYIISSGIFRGDEWKMLLLPGSYAAALALCAGFIRMYKTPRPETDFEPGPTEIS